MPRGLKATVILIASTKGGGGKSTLAECLLVCAARAGIASIGYDLDDQRHFAQWQLAREVTRQSIPDVKPTEVRPLPLERWREIKPLRADHRLIIIDTHAINDSIRGPMLGLAELADLVVVPVQPTHNDVSSNEAYLLSLRDSGKKVLAVMNRVNRQTKSFRDFQLRLIKVARVAPTQIPQAEDLHVHVPVGLTPLDIRGARGMTELESLWEHLRHEVSI